MPWVKLDDQFFAHPKVVEVSNEAKLLYLAGLTYCAGQLTDGRIGRGALRAVAASLGLDPALAVELVGVGLWSATEAGYAVHDYLEYQPSAEQVRAQRAENARRQAEWRGRRRATRADERNAVTNGVSNAPRNAPVTPTPYPSPSPREVNSPPNGEEQTLVRARPGRASARATPLEGFEDWWGCYPRKIGKGKARDAWKARRLTAADVPRLVAAVERQCLSAQWQSEGGRFIPHPATWLNQERWEDEPEVALPAGARASPNGHGQFSPRFERTMDTLARFNAAGDREERR